MDPRYTSSFAALRLYPQLILPLILWRTMYTPTHKILITSHRLLSQLLSYSTTR